MAIIAHFPDRRHADPRRTYAEYCAQLAALEQSGVGLSMWQAAFVASVRRRFDQGWTTLTVGQAECLAWLYAEKIGKDKEPA